MKMSELFAKHNCDKGHKHGYHAVYNKQWKHLRDEPINFLEIGIWKGESTKAFLEYFPNATIYGIDIFTRIDPSEVSVLKHERMKWLKGDSMSYSIQAEMKKEWGDVKFDIILDDGKHTPEANALTFNNISPFLKDDGMYFVEDVFPLHRMTPAQMEHQWIQRHADELNYLEFTKFEKAISGWKKEEFDLRDKSKQPESYIFKMTK